MWRGVWDRGTHERRERDEPEAENQSQAHRDDRSATRLRSVPLSHELTDARERADLEREKDAQHAPLHGARELHRGERSRRVMPEHDAIDDEDERLQQRHRDRGQRERDHLFGDWTCPILGVAQTTRSPMRRRSVVLAASAAQLWQ